MLTAFLIFAGPGLVLMGWAVVILFRLKNTKSDPETRGKLLKRFSLLASANRIYPWTIFVLLYMAAILVAILRHYGKIN